MLLIQIYLCLISFIVGGASGFPLYLLWTFDLGIGQINENSHVSAHRVDI